VSLMSRREPLLVNIQIDAGVLAKTIGTYQALGDWAPHLEITRPAWEATVYIFLHAGLIKRRHR